MKTVILTLFTLFLSVQMFAATVKLTGTVKTFDGASPAGATITFSLPDDFSEEDRTAKLLSNGEYEAIYEISDWVFQTRLYQITVSMDGYKTASISKVVTTSVILEDIYLVPEGAFPHKPYLNLIALSSKDQNIVAWEREAGMDIDYYIVKKQNADGVYDSIGKVDYDAEFSLFIDEATDRETEEFYLIVAKMNDGTYSLPSNTRKTFELKLSEYSGAQVDGVEISFDLSVFDGIDYPLEYINSIDLMRSFDGGDFELYASKAMEGLTYVDVLRILPYDYLTEAGRYVYKAIIHYSDTCKPAVLKSDSGPFSQSISNLAESVVLADETSAAESDAIGAISVAPIPARDYFVVSGKGECFVQIFTLTGELVLEKTFIEKVDFDVQEFNKGIYLISVSNGSGTKSFRQIIE